MKKKRDLEMTLLYAAPSYFERETEKKADEEYPNNQLEEPDEWDDTEMNDVYGGPEMCEDPDPDETEPAPYPENALEDDEPEPMRRVYAGPDIMAPVYAAPEFMREPMMKTVYGGPEMMRGKKRQPPMMQAVYACPPVKRPEQNDEKSRTAPRKPMMRLVYAAPPVMGKPRRPVPGGHFCPNCGTEVSETANFCSECGARLPKKPTPDNAPKNTMI